MKNKKIQIFTGDNPYFYYERINEKTPSGGDYSEAHFLDDDYNYVHRDAATKIIIKELTKNGELINETFLYKNPDISEEEESDGPTLK